MPFWTQFLFQIATFPHFVLFSCFQYCFQNVFIFNISWIDWCFFSNIGLQRFWYIFKMFSLSCWLAGFGLAASCVDIYFCPRLNIHITPTRRTLRLHLYDVSLLFILFLWRFLWRFHARSFYFHYVFMTIFMLSPQAFCAVFAAAHLSSETSSAGNHLLRRAQHWRQWFGRRLPLRRPQRSAMLFPRKRFFHSRP